MSVEHVVREESHRSHFAMIPNVVDDLELSAKAYRLYGHLKRLTGERGKANEGQDAMAAKCKMAKNTIVAAKRELVKKKLIRIKESKDQTTPDEIIILDIWSRNTEHFAKDDRGANEVPRAAQSEYRDAAQNVDRKKSSTEEGEKNSPRGSDEPANKDLVTELTDRTTEVGLTPTSRQKSTWASEIKSRREKGADLADLRRLFAKVTVKASEGYFCSLKQAENGNKTNGHHPPPDSGYERKPVSKPRKITDEEAGLV